MERSLTALLKDGANEFEARFDTCRVMAGGEFAGNIEVDFSCDAAYVDTILQYLRIQSPGASPSDPALATGDRPGGLQLVFWTEPSNLDEGPESITLLWDDTAIREIEATLEDSVPIEEQIRFLEPSEILDTLPVSTSNHVLLASNRAGWWYVFAVLLLGFGALVAATTSGLELPSPRMNWALGASMIAAGFAVAFHLGATPYEQIWLDRDRRCVLVVSGRTRNPLPRLADAPGRSLDEFDHVRVFQRWRMAQGADDSDQEVWFVTLEGRIPFASEDGLVHLHDETMSVGEYSSEFTARRVAAVVSFHTGLKILDTGHDQTA